MLFLCTPEEPKVLSETKPSGNCWALAASMSASAREAISCKICRLKEPQAHFSFNHSPSFEETTVPAASPWFATWSLCLCPHFLFFVSGSLFESPIVPSPWVWQQTDCKDFVDFFSEIYILEKRRFWFCADILWKCLSRCAEFCNLKNSQKFHQLNLGPVASMTFSSLRPCLYWGQRRSNPMWTN